MLFGKTAQQAMTDNQIDHLRKTMVDLEIRLAELGTSCSAAHVRIDEMSKAEKQDKCEHPVNLIVFDSSRTAMQNRKASKDSFTAHIPSETDKNCKECCKTLATYKTRSAVCHKAKGQHYRALAKYYSELKA